MEIEKEVEEYNNIISKLEALPKMVKFQSLIEGIELNMSPLSYTKHTLTMNGNHYPIALGRWYQGNEKYSRSLSSSVFREVLIEKRVSVDELIKYIGNKEKKEDMKKIFNLFYSFKHTKDSYKACVSKDLSSITIAIEQRSYSEGYVISIDGSGLSENYIKDLLSFKKYEEQIMNLLSGFYKHYNKVKEHNKNVVEQLDKILSKYRFMNEL